MLSLTVSYLEHLDEGNAKVKICHVATYQGQAEEGSDWQDGADVDPPSHLDGLASIEECRRSSQNLGHYRSEGQVPTSEDNRVV